MKGTRSPIDQTSLYRDRRIQCTTEALVIRGYYFPFGNKKVIPYDRIRSIHQYNMTSLTGQWRIWGSGDFRHYMNFDPDRPRKKEALIIDVGKFIKPVITPDHPAQVINIVESRLTQEPPAT